MCIEGEFKMSGTLNAKTPRTLKDKMFWLIPKYAYLPLALLIIINFAVYLGNRIVTYDMYHYDFTLDFEKNIPFVPEAVIIYFGAFIQWIIGYIVIVRESKERCYRVVTGEIIAKFICLAIYIIIPTTMARPVIEGDGFFEQVMAFVYTVDNPKQADNLLPSLHCLESWICFRCAIGCKKVPKWYVPVQFIFTLMVFASTLLVKQHIFVDIPAGVIVAEIGLLISSIIFNWKARKNAAKDQQ